MTRTTAVTINPDDLVKINALFDTTIADLGLKNDAALSRVLEVAPPVVSKTRSGVLKMGLHLMIRLHDATGKPLAEIREAIGAAPLVRAYGTV